MSFILSPSTLRDNFYAMKLQYPRIFLFALAILVSSAVAAQTTDRLKYYIAYDGSGSIAHFDKQENLKYLFQLLTSYRNSMYNSSASFDLLVFGQDKNNLIETEEFPFVGKVSSQSFARSLNRKIAYSSAQKYTHIIPALNEVMIGATNGKNEVSSGLFIFTDGMLGPNDLDGYNLEEYIDEVRARLLAIELLDIPVFIIQCSPVPSSYLSETSIVNSELNYFSDARYFWVSNQISARDSAATLNAFNQYIHRANQLIAYNRSIPNNELSMAIKLRMAMNSKDILGSSFFNENLAEKEKAGEGGAVERKDESLEIQESFTTQSISVINEVSRVLDASSKAEWVSSSDMGTIQWAINYILNNDTDRQFQSYLSQLDKQLKSNFGRTKFLSEIKEKGVSSDLSYEFPHEFRKLENKVEENRMLKAIEAEGADLTPTEETKSQAGRSWEETIILGMTDYVIERAKMEAIHLFLERVFKLVDEKDTTELLKKVLLPNLYSALEKPNTYNDAIRLKELFQRDIEALPENIRNHSGKIANSEGIVAFLGFYELYNEIMNTGSLEDAFKSLEHSLKNIPMKLKNSKLQKSLLFTSHLIGFLSTYDLTEMDPEEMEEFTLILVAISLDTSNVKRLDKDHAIAVVKELYRDYKVLSSQVKNFNQLLKKDMGNDVDGYRNFHRDLFISILDKTASLLFSGNEILSALDFRDQERDAFELADLNRKARNCIDAYLYIQDKKYAKAGILLAPELVTFLDEGRVREKSQLIIEVVAEVSDASTAEEVKNIISKHALPVASYKVKRSDRGSLMLTAYPGIGGVFYSEKTNKWTSSVGIVSPIGIEYTFSRPSKRSISFMFSLIDIGNIINYRLLLEENEVEEVNFERIFSPGIIASYGIPRLPLSIMAGGMANPLRCVAGISFDLPLFSVWQSG